MQIPDEPAIMADFCHVNTVRGRKVCVLTVEVPLEDLPEVLKRLGNPIGADSIPVAIAPLDLKKVKEHLDVSKGHEVPGSNPIPADQPPSPLPDSAGKPPTGESSPPVGAPLKLSQQCALRCKDHRLWGYLGVRNEGEAILRIYKDCEIQSRSDLDRSKVAAAKWEYLERNFYSYLTDQKYGQARR